MNRNLFRTQRALVELGALLPLVVLLEEDEVLLARLATRRPQLLLERAHLVSQRLEQRHLLVVVELYWRRARKLLILTRAHRAHYFFMDVARRKAGRQQRLLHVRHGIVVKIGKGCHVVEAGGQHHLLMLRAPECRQKSSQRHRGDKATLHGSGYLAVGRRGSKCSKGVSWGASHLGHHRYFACPRCGTPRASLQPPAAPGGDIPVMPEVFLTPSRARASVYLT